MLHVCVQVRARLQKMGALASMNIFLRQEIDRMQRVITLVRQTLTDLKLAIEGTIIMSEVYRNVSLFYLVVTQRALIECPLSYLIETELITQSITIAASSVISQSESA